MDYSRDVLLEDDIISTKHNESPESHDQDYHGIGMDMDMDLFPGKNETFNETMEFIPYILRPETYIVPILFAIIFIIGVMGNGTLIGIFIKHRTMRNVPNMYICSLAIGDVLVILFCVPFTATLYTFESWPYGEFICKFSEFIKDLSVGVSVFTLTALSADRYFAIVDPMRKLHGRRATKITCITIAGIWVLSVVTALPSALFSYIKVFDAEPTMTFYVCYPFPPELGDKYPQVMVAFRFLVYYLCPLVLIATFYIIMARHLVASTRNMPGEAQGGQAKQIQARKKVAKMILSFVVIFAVCFFPSHLFMLFFYFYPKAEYHYNDFWHACRITGFCLSFINSCINPITLYCVSGTFRKQFNEHLFCCLCDADGRSRPRRRAGFGCGCVSLSSAGPVFGDYRLRNGYTPGRGLCRGSTTNSNGYNSTNTMMKRKSTWDTQSTMSHPLHNYIAANVHQGNHNNGNGTTATANERTSSPDTSTNPTLSMSMNPAGPGQGQSLLPNSSMNSSFPLTHHPYQKEYQDYLNRINALEKGELPLPISTAAVSPDKIGNYTKTKLAKTKENQQNQGENETETSFITNSKCISDSAVTNSTTAESRCESLNCPSRVGSDSGCSEGCGTGNEADSPLIVGKCKKVHCHKISGEGSGEEYQVSLPGN